jgi:hypothetical protein
MIDEVQDEIDEIKGYLKRPGIDKAFYEGKLEALRWVIKRLPEEG